MGYFTISQCVCVCEGDGGWGGGEKSLNKWNHGKNIEIFYHEGDVVFGHSLLKK